VQSPIGLAAAVLALADLCQRNEWELDRAGASGIYVLTRRSGTAIHVIAGTADEVLQAVKTEGRLAVLRMDIGEPDGTNVADEIARERDDPESW
jgi:hypothetical protein